MLVPNAAALMCNCTGFAVGGFGFVWVSFEVFVGFAAVFFGVWRGVLLCDFLSIPPLYIESTCG
jgi:hypothetical protein